MAIEMNKCVQNTEIPKFTTKGKTPQIQNDHLKETDPTNYRPITCQPMICKTLTAQIRDEILYSLMSSRIFTAELKGCHKETIGTGALLYIHILNKSKTRLKNLVMAGIYNKKVCGRSKLDTTQSKNL